MRRASPPFLLLFLLSDAPLPCRPRHRRRPSPVARRHLAGELLQAKFRLLTPFGVLRRAKRCGGCVRSQHACPPPPSAVHAWIWESLPASRQGGAPSPPCKRAAAGGVPPAHAFRRASPREALRRVRAFAARLPSASPSAVHAWIWESLPASQQGGAVHAMRPGTRRRYRQRSLGTHGCAAGARGGARRRSTASRQPRQPAWYHASLRSCYIIYIYIYIYLPTTACT